MPLPFHFLHENDRGKVRSHLFGKTLGAKHGSPKFLEAMRGRERLKWVSGVRRLNTWLLVPSNVHFGFTQIRTINIDRTYQFSALGCKGTSLSTCIFPNSSSSLFFSYSLVTINRGYFLAREGMVCKYFLLFLPCEFWTCKKIFRQTWEKSVAGAPKWSLQSWFH